MNRYHSYNANPQHNRVGDCVIRAISKILGQDWERTYIELCIQGFIMADMPSSNAVWGTYLRGKGFRREVVPTEYDGEYTVERFCEEHPEGIYMLAIDGHVVAVEDGYYYDAFDSGNETPIYFWYKEKK